MKTSEAIASLKTLCNTCTMFPKCVNNKPECFQAIEMAISALEKQGWHNARKDPPKRPDGMWNIYCVYTRFDRCGIAKYYAHGKWDGYDEDGDQIGEYEIIAYCNFPGPYTEEEL